MKTLLTNMDKEKKSSTKTHSMTQKFSLNTHLENVANQYINVGSSLKHENSMSPDKNNIQNISH